MLHAYGRLFEHNLIPDSQTSIDQTNETRFKIELLIIKQGDLNLQTDAQSATKRETGLFSTLTQFLSLAGTEDEGERAENTAYLSLAKDCIQKCHLDSLFSLAGCDII